MPKIASKVDTACWHGVVVFNAIVMVTDHEQVHDHGHVCLDGATYVKHLGDSVQNC